jgi:predicted Zn-ribbon and HTH transcriptional regulator
MGENAKEKIIKKMVMVAHWLAGNLASLENDENDKSLLTAINEWLEIRVQDIDPLLIGKMVCDRCGYEWESFGYKSQTQKAVCPNCGQRQLKVPIDDD